MCPLLVQRTHGFAELLGKQDLEKMELLSIPCAYLELLSFPSFFFFSSHTVFVWYLSLLGNWCAHLSYNFRISMD